LLLPRDDPHYYIGNSLNFAISTITHVIAIPSLHWIIADNKQRQKKDLHAELAGLSQWQIQNLDWRHPALIWRP
jgi:hypothetical protein